MPDRHRESDAGVGERSFDSDDVLSFVSEFQVTDEMKVVFCHLLPPDAADSSSEPQYDFVADASRQTPALAVSHAANAALDEGVAETFAGEAEMINEAVGQLEPLLLSLPRRLDTTSPRAASRARPLSQ
jgi:hypothetical protein